MNLLLLLIVVVKDYANLLALVLSNSLLELLTHEGVVVLQLLIARVVDWPIQIVIVVLLLLNRDNL